MSENTLSSQRGNAKKLVFLFAVLAVVVAIVLFVTGQRATVKLAFDEGGGQTVANDAGGSQLPINHTLSASRFATEGAVYFAKEQCLSGSCLRFDGYSTSVPLPDDALTAPAEGFAIRAWVAPRAIASSEFAAIYSQYDAESDSLLELGYDHRGRWGLRSQVGETTAELWSGDDRLQEGMWAQLSVSYDGETKSAQLFRDGAEVAAEAIDAAALPAQWRAPAFAGRSARFRDTDSLFATGAFSGLIDLLEVHPYHMDAGQIADAHKTEAQAAGGRVKQAVGEIPSREWLPPTSERYRPHYHAHARAGWTGRPLAPFYFQDKYHLFFLTNPKGPFPGRGHWGHFVSDDLVSWKEMPVAMAPGDLSPDGLGAGSAVVDANGQPVIFYSARDTAQGRQAGKMLSARPAAGDSSLSRWTTDEAPAIVQKSNEGYLGDFHDPFVFKSADGARWFALLGGMSAERNGAVQIYESADLKTWSHQGELFGIDRKAGDFKGLFRNHGPQWSSPVLLPLGKGKKGKDKHVLIVQTEGRTNPTITFYWVGQWDEKKRRFTADSSEGLKLDISRHGLLAPTGFVDPKSGRSILFFHADSEDTPQLRYRAGWANSMGLALQLGLGANDSLSIAPVDEMSKLRGEALVDVTDTTFAGVRDKIRGLRADVFEVDALIDMDSAGDSRVGFFVLRGAGNVERTLVSWDKPRGLAVIQRDRSGIDVDFKALSNIGQKAGEIVSPYRVRMFVDRSMVETILGESHMLFGNVYAAGAESDGFALLGPSDVKVKSFRMWRIRPTMELAAEGAPERIPAAKWVWESTLANHDFGSCSLEGWSVVSGDAFHKDAVVNRSHFENDLDASFNPARVIPGFCHLWGLQAPGAQAAVGEMHSPAFTVDGEGAQLNFLIGGGYDPERLYVALVDAARPNQPLRQASGAGSERYRRVYWDLSEFAGRELKIKVVDNSTAKMGYLNIDDFNLGSPPAPAAQTQP